MEVNFKTPINLSAPGEVYNFGGLSFWSIKRLTKIVVIQNGFHYTNHSLLQFILLQFKMLQQKCGRSEGIVCTETNDLIRL